MTTEERAEHEKSIVEQLDTVSGQCSIWVFGHIVELDKPVIATCAIDGDKKRKIAGRGNAHVVDGRWAFEPHFWTPQDGSGAPVKRIGKIEQPMPEYYGEPQYLKRVPASVLRIFKKYLPIAIRRETRHKEEWEKARSQ
jgi:hypothetical protein